MNLLLPYLSAILAWLTYHPANLGFLAWVAYAPLLIYIFRSPLGLVRGGAIVNPAPKLSHWVSVRGRKLISPFNVHVFLGGFLFFCLGGFWVRHVTWAGLVVIPPVLALYWVGFGAIARYLYSNILSLVLVPALWVALEYVRSFFLTGFPWFFAGHTQYDWLGLIQITDITGAYGVSFLVIMVNTAIAMCVVSLTPERSHPARTAEAEIAHHRHTMRVKDVLCCLGLIGIAFGIVLGYGYIRMDRIMFEPGPKVGIVQGNIPQSLKLNPEDPYDLYDKHLKLSMRLAVGDNKPDLIVWAETMFPYPCSMSLGRTDKWWAEQMELLKEPAKFCMTPHVIGAVSYESGQTETGHRIYNSAYYINETGKILGRYDKVHLVPISEYVPMRKVVPWLDNIILALSELQEIRQMESGEYHELFTLPARTGVPRQNESFGLESGGPARPGKLNKDYKFGVLICYESIFPAQSRDIARQGGDFIINISNDGWFKDSAELEQMLAISAFRAVENRRAVIRATNTGISAVIDPIGRIKVLKDEQDKSKEVEGAWVEEIPVPKLAGTAVPGNTFYTRNGDLFAILCLAVVGGWAIISRIKISKNT